MVPSTEKKIVLNEAQVAALANPLRSNLILALRTGGPSSVSKLALSLSLDPKILYYPLRKLIEVGLVVQTGSDRSAKRIEAVYALASNRMELSKSTSLESRQKLMRTTLRCVEQEIFAAQKSEGIQELSIIRVPIWLTKEDQKELIQDIDELANKYQARSQQGETDLVMWTSLVVPIPKRVS